MSTTVATVTPTIEELETQLAAKQRETDELLHATLTAKRAKVDPEQQKVADAQASVAALKKQIRKAKKAELRALLKARPSVLHPTSRTLGPPSDVMIDYPKKADWFASLPAETRFEVANYGLQATRAAMIYECDRVNDEEDDAGFYGLNTDCFQADILLAANLVDDGAVWVGASTKRPYIIVDGKEVEVPEPVEE